jgi:hypothetical protein
MKYGRGVVVVLGITESQRGVCAVICLSVPIGGSALISFFRRQASITRGSLIPFVDLHLLCLPTIEPAAFRP